MARRTVESPRGRRNSEGAGDGVSDGRAHGLLPYLLRVSAHPKQPPPAPSRTRYPLTLLHRSRHYPFTTRDPARHY